MLLDISYDVVYATIQHVSDFNFVVAGDWGYDKKAHQTVINMQNKSPELVLALGDLSYQKSADCWFQMMSPLINKTKQKWCLEIMSTILKIVLGLMSTYRNLI